MLKGEHPRTIPTKFGSYWGSGTGEEDKIYEANLNQTLPEWSLDGVKSDAKYVIHLTYIYLDTKM
jgi:hypothetical protein